VWQAQNRLRASRFAPPNMAPKHPKMRPILSAQTEMPMIVRKCVATAYPSIFDNVKLSVEITNDNAGRMNKHGPA
jgi:hypothetical protein